MKNQIKDREVFFLTQIAVKYRQIEPHRWFQLFWMAACVLQI